MDKWKIEAGLHELKVLVEQTEEKLAELYKLTGPLPGGPTPLDPFQQSLRAAKLELLALIEHLHVVF